MKLHRLGYHADQGWSDTFPELDSERTLVLTFGDASYRDNQAPLEQLRQAFPNSQLIGCSTSGEIHGNTVCDQSLSVAIAQFEHTDLHAAVASVTESDESYVAGREIAQQLTQQEGLKAIFLLSDGLGVNGSQLVRGINDIVRDDVIVTGGLAGDGDRFGSTWCLEGGKPVSGIVRAIGLYGDRVRVGYGSKGGWDIFGPERHVTRSEDNVLFELDGKPALQLYKEYLGDRAEGLPATGLLFPLALRQDREDERKLVRTILAVDEQNQSMTFAGDIPEGSLVQLMRANFDRLIDGAGDAGLQTRERNEDNSMLAIAISCVGRRLVLGERTEEEVEAALASFPPGTEQVGFYSYGEISPLGLGSCDLHNQTMTLTTIGEC